MATRVVMAQLSPTMEEGKLVEWKVSEGDEVSQGDILAEVETDKANMDIEAMTAGTVRALLASEGDVVEVGALIGVLGDPDDLVAEAPSADEDEPEETRDSDEAEADEDEAEEVDAEEAEGKADAEEAEAADAPEETESDADGSRDGRVRVSPVARRMAEEEGIDVGS